LGVERLDLYLRYDQPLTQEELQRFKTLLKRRADREPVAYITGVKECWGIEFKVTPDVLIPRPETEFLIEKALNLIPEPSGSVSYSPMRILDIGTGSGTIIVSLAVNRPGHLYFASDISLQAVRVADSNAIDNGLDGKIQFFAGELFAPINTENEKFDLILSNPPYIADSELYSLEPEVCKYEPVHALDGGKDGLEIIKRIIDSAPGFLNHGGFLLLEIGYDQQKRVSNIIKESGSFSEVSFVTDYAGYERVVMMRKI